MARSFLFGLVLIFAASSIGLYGADKPDAKSIDKSDVKSKSDVKTDEKSEGKKEKGEETKLPKAAPPAVKGLPTATITVVLSSADELLNDLEFMLGLAKAPNQFKTLSGNLDVFLEGVDRKQPIGLRSYLKGGKFDHILSLPIKTSAKLKDFLNNIDALDVKFKLIRPNLYRLSKLFDGYLYYDGTYAHLGEKEVDVVALKGSPPPKELLGVYDLVMVVDNREQKLEDRRKGFDDINKEMRKAIEQYKRKEKEEDADFQIRKAAARQQLAELERFFVESSHLSLGWTTSAKSKNAVMDIEMTAVPETSLAASIDLFGKTADEFAGVSQEGAIGVASINFPIDDLRKGHMVDMTKLLRPRAKQRIDASTTLTDAQKGVDKDISDLGFDVSDGIGNAGFFNGFLRMYPNEKGGGYSLLGGAKVADSAKILNMLQRMADREGKDKVKLDVTKAEDVSIHTLAVPQKQQTEYPELFAKDATAYIGTSPTAFWYSVGDNALERLKTAIGQAKQPGDGKAASTGLDMHGRLLPWVQIMDRRQGKKGDVELRKQALAAFKGGKDTASIKVVRVEKDVKVHAQFDEDVLHFVGSAIAKFVKESLE